MIDCNTLSICHHEAFARIKAGEASRLTLWARRRAYCAAGMLGLGLAIGLANLIIAAMFCMLSAWLAIDAMGMQRKARRTLSIAASHRARSAQLFASRQ